MRLVPAGLITGTLLALSVASPGAAVQSLSVDVVTVRGDQAVILAVCPVDPPSTLFLVATVDGTRQLLGSQSVTCTRRTQRFVLNLDQALPRGTVLTDVTATVSGDGGEVSGFDTRIVTR